MPENFGFEKMKLEYVAIRAEIVQSISYQHQILLAGYGATGAFVSFVAVKAPSPNFVALIIVPFILLGMAALWIVECNRMVRASYYIGRILWRSLRDEQIDWPKNNHWQSAEWECWIRSGSGVASRFRECQHRSQSLVVLWGPAFITAVASGLALTAAFMDANSKSPALPRACPWILILFTAIALVMWWRVRKDIVAISDLGKSPIPDTPVDLDWAVPASQC